MISGSVNFPNVSEGLQMYPVQTENVCSSLEATSSSENHSNSLLYTLSLLRDKLHQVESLVSILIAAPGQSQPESRSIAVASMSTMIQEIIVAASSMMFTCQQMANIGANPSRHNNNLLELHQPRVAKAHQETGLSPPNFGTNNRSAGHERGQASFFSCESFEWYGDNNSNSTSNIDNYKAGVHVISSNNNTNNNNNRVDVGRRGSSHQGTGENNMRGSDSFQGKSHKNYDIIELDAADLLAKYTHYCQVCGKGFKRDANLRMHMRAHGDEYRTSAALSNPMKHNNENGSESSMNLPRKYSCPQEGCRWNQRHAKFQPLKSMVCVKNHYKRSHCPKMYVCKRCNRKQFSVLSDLRTHEKHCGDLKWQCSCGTTFSRKDKLMGHVALFVGHTPAINSGIKTAAAGRVENQSMQMQLNDR